MVRDPGYIKLWRRLQSHWIMQDPVALQVWTYLLLGAAYEAKAVKILGEDVILRPGQLVRSRGFICRDLAQGEDKIRRALRKLEKDGMITTQGRKYGTLITVTAWEDWQKGSENRENPAPLSAPLSAPLNGEDAPSNPPPFPPSLSTTSAELRQASAPLSAPLNGEDAPSNPPTDKEEKKKEEEGSRERAPLPPASRLPECPTLDELDRLLPGLRSQYDSKAWAAAYQRCCSYTDGQRWLVPGTRRPVLDPRQRFLEALNSVTRPSGSDLIRLEKLAATLRREEEEHVGNPVNGDSPINAQYREAWKEVRDRRRAVEERLSHMTLTFA